MRAQLCPTLCSPLDYIAHQTSLSMEFSRQESWNALPFPTPGDLPDPGIKTMSLLSLALAGGLFTTVSLGKPVPTLNKTKPSWDFLDGPMAKTPLPVHEAWVQSLVWELKTRQLRPGTAKKIKINKYQNKTTPDLPASSTAEMALTEDKFWNLTN